MALFVDDVAARLVSQSVVALSAINISSRSAVPTGDGPFISLTETGGSGATYIQNQNGARSRLPSLQVLTRAKTAQVARSTAEAAWLALDGIWNTTVNGTFYQSIKPRQEPTDLGQPDAQGRAMFSFNIDGERNS